MDLRHANPLHGWPTLLRSACELPFFALENRVMALGVAFQLYLPYGLGNTGANITPDELLHTRRWM
jgi:hypothetical protein